MFEEQTWTNVVAFTFCNCTEDVDSIQFTEIFAL